MKQPIYKTFIVSILYIWEFYPTNLYSIFQIYGNQTDINVLKRAMATMQHHDAVTGTEKQHVAEGIY